MFDRLEEIERQLSVGEDSRAEFKEVVLGPRGVRSPNSEKVAAEIVAFANADGGVIFVGVDDEGIVRGLPDKRLGDIEQWIINVATHDCDPPIRPTLRRERLRRSDGTEVVIILVEIRRGLFVHATRSGRHYERVGSTKQILTGSWLARLFQERGRAFVFDEHAVPTATIDDLDHTRLNRFFESASLRIPLLDVIGNTKVVAEGEGGVQRPTVAGLLAFGRAVKSHLPSAYIEAAVYRGSNLTSRDLVHSEQIDGPVDTQIDDATAFVNRFMLKPALKPNGREDHPQYDIGSIHEALVNAVAHRDYSITGSKIRLFLFSDRVEIYSPGALPNTLTIETMAYRVFTRNQLLVTFLSRMASQRTGNAYIESRGEGVRKILDGSEAHAGRRPVYELFGDELRLTIWARPSPHELTASAGID